MVCDVAYVVQLGQLERRFLADRQAVLTAVLAGHIESDVPLLEDEVERFDAALEAEPEAPAEDDDRMVMLRALGAA